MFNTLQQIWDNLDFSLEWRHAGLFCCRIVRSLGGVDTFYDQGWTHYGTVITRWHMVWSVRDAQACLLGSTGLSLWGEGAMWL